MAAAPFCGVFHGSSQGGVCGTSVTFSRPNLGRELLPRALRERAGALSDNYTAQQDVLTLSDSHQVLLLTEHEKDAAIWQRRKLAQVLVRLGLAKTCGLFVARVAGAFGVYLGRHDNGPVVPDHAALRAVELMRGSS